MWAEQIGQPRALKLHPKNLALGRGRHRARRGKAGNEGMHTRMGFNAGLERSIGVSFQRFEKSVRQIAAMHSAMVSVQARLEIGHARANKSADEGGFLIGNTETCHGGHLDFCHNGLGIHQHTVTVENYAMGQHTPPEKPGQSATHSHQTQITRLGQEAAALFADLHVQCFGAPWPEEDFDRLLASSGVVGLVLEADGEPAGLSLIRTIAGECEILTIGIAKTARKQGLGRQLLTASETEARLGGARRMILEVSHTNTPAIALYDRAGYIEIGRRRAYYRDGSDARVLARPL